MLMMTVLSLSLKSFKIAYHMNTFCGPTTCVCFCEAVTRNREQSQYPYTYAETLHRLNGIINYTYSYHSRDTNDVSKAFFYFSLWNRESRLPTAGDIHRKRQKKQYILISSII